MDKFLNQQVSIHLKNSKTCLTGMLADLDDDYVYLQSDSILVIPNSNIMYFSIYVPQSEQQSIPAQDNFIKVFIDGKLLTQISVPGNINISSANDRVLELVYSNEEVQKALQNKVQKTLEYAPGEVNIILTEAAEKNVNNKPDDSSSFSMGSGNPISNYLTPSEMVNRLNNSRNREKKNE